MSKSAFAEFLGCSRANVSKMTAEGGKLAAAVTADNRIDVDLALQLKAAHSDPVREHAARVPTGRGGASGEEVGDGAESSGGYLAARARKAAADAKVAEFLLAEKERRLVGAEGVKAAAGELGEVLLQGLEDSFADCASRARDAATVGDAMRLARRLAHDFATQMQATIARRVREVTLDG